MLLKLNRIAVCAMAVGAFMGLPVKADEPPVLSNQITPAGNVTSVRNDQLEKMAATRYKEMLDRMQAAVEEVAELYGNPTFLQVFTNDFGQASRLKQRLKLAQSEDEMRLHLNDLRKQRDDLEGDIALKERETTKLSSRLTRQRLALDSLAGAIEMAQKAVEDTTK